MRRKVTIEDVAAAAGVSRQTVTRAMNDLADISPATRTRVLDVARTLRYRPSRFGRGLVKPDQRTVGLVVHDLTNPYYPELASSIVGAASARGWNVVLADTVHSLDRMADMASLVDQVDVVVGYPWFGPETGRAIYAGVPIVQIGPSADSPHAGIDLGLTTAMTALAEHLHTVGVRHPVALTPTADDARTLEFTDLMAGHGLQVRQVVTGAEERDPTAAAVAAMLADRAPVDAILAFNDLLACWAMKALTRAGVRIPDDVRVVGIDGLSLGTMVTPELTTLALDMSEVARAAVELAIEIFEADADGEAGPPRRHVEHRLVLRESA